MHFCTVCNNMYYLRIDEQNPNKLDYYCRNCGNEDKILAQDNMCVSKTFIKKSDNSFNHIINEYTKLDPTLPRVSTILCPNSECETNTKNKKREIIYIRYDDTNMKYVYLCSECSTIWQTNNV
jgi:DNA-directed RNA polymerase subunit M/transcription elongation factor TFIIS